MSRRVLIVDDSVAVRTQVRSALQDVGFSVLEAFDGADGVEKILGTPDLAAVICDVNMPRMDGLELLEKVMRHGVTLPILMLTTEAQPALIQRAKKAGAKGWLVKPFKPPLLVAAIEKLTGVKPSAPAKP